MNARGRSLKVKHGDDISLISLKSTKGPPDLASSSNERISTNFTSSALLDDIRAIQRNACALLNSCKDSGLAVNTGKTKYMEGGRHQGMTEMSI